MTMATTTNPSPKSQPTATQNPSVKPFHHPKKITKSALPQETRTSTYTKPANRPPKSNLKPANRPPKSNLDLLQLISKLRRAPQGVTKTNNSTTMKEAAKLGTLSLYVIAPMTTALAQYAQVLAKQQAAVVRILGFRHDDLD